MPTDEQLTDKASAIVVGTVEASYPVENETLIQTVTELRVERAIKGGIRADELIRIVELGGFIEGRGGLHVPGAPQFEQGERVLLFLHPHSGQWRVVDMALGRFNFRTSTMGERLLVRNMEDVVGWDHAGREHRERVRKEQGFLQFIENRAAGRARNNPDYMVDAAAVTLRTETATATTTDRFEVTTMAAPFPPETYVSWASGLPGRWPNISAGVTFYKRSTQNLSGASDGGVSIIQNALQAWNNEPNSNINLQYGGQRAEGAVRGDGVNIVEFNDPQGLIGGSFGGAGTVGITLIRYVNQHEYPAGSKKTWWSISEADVVFQDGITASHPVVPTAMTHEIGHGIGWRHSNEDMNNGPCDPATMECTSNAIMNSQSISSLGYSLQVWDQHAAEAVYPGASAPTCTAPSITSQPTSRTITSGQSTTLTVTAAGTGPFTYQWFVGSSGNTASPISGGTSSSLTVSPTSTTNYWVRISNACGVVNSVTATVSVTASCQPPVITSQPTSRTITQGQTTTLSVSATGTPAFTYQWYVGTSGNTATPVAGGNSSAITVSPSTITSYWVRISNACGFVNSSTATVTVTSASTGVSPALSIGDMNGDGRADIAWRNQGSGENALWMMNGASTPTGVFLPTVTGGLRMVATGDVNGDRRDDIIWRDPATGQNAIWLMNGATVSGQYMQTVPTNWQVNGTGDFNADGYDDVLWREINTGDVAIWFMRGGDLVSSNIVNNAAPALRVFGIGDLDADGRDDIVFRNESNGQNAVWLMNGSNIKQGVFLPSLTVGYNGVAVDDFNGDGRADLLFRNQTSGANIMWTMNGTTVTGQFTLAAADPSLRVAATGDYNADGRADIFWRGETTGDTAVWLMNGATISSGAFLPDVDPAFEVAGRRV